MTAPGTVPARTNPFRVERLHGLRFRFADGVDLDALLARLPASRGRGALVGTHGSGKSTLLLEVAERLVATGHDVRHLRIGRGRRSLACAERTALVRDADPHTAVLLDGASHLSPWAWLRLRRAARPAGTLIVTAHRPGRLPTLIRTATSPELLVDLASALGAPLDLELARDLHHHHRGNLRHALLELYDTHANQGPISA